MSMDIDHVDIKALPPFDHFHLKIFNKHVACVHGLPSNSHSRNSSHSLCREAPNTGHFMELTRRARPGYVNKSLSVVRYLQMFLCPSPRRPHNSARFRLDWLPVRTCCWVIAHPLLYCMAPPIHNCDALHTQGCNETLLKYYFNEVVLTHYMRSLATCTFIIKTFKFQKIVGVYLFACCLRKNLRLSFIQIVNIVTVEITFFFYFKILLGGFGCCYFRFFSPIKYTARMPYIKLYHSLP